MSHAGGHRSQTSHAWIWVRQLAACSPSRATRCPPTAQLLLLVTQHLPRALFGDAHPPNLFLAALRSIGDEQYALVPENGDADPEQGKQRRHCVSFSRLHDVIAAKLPHEDSVLLLYLLLHGNRDFLDYCLSRTDADTLLLPLLPTLYEASSLRPNQMYMLLIVILMLSQDCGFVSAAQSVRCCSCSCVRGVPPRGDARLLVTTTL